MTNESGGEATGPACGCGGGNCGPARRWIWIVLALGIAGVLIAKQAGKRASAPAGTGPESVPASSADVHEPRVSTKPLPRLVDLGATQCIPCRMMAPILEDLKQKYAGQLDVQFIDVWENRDAGARYQIRAIPTQIFYSADGHELFRHEGFISREEILAKWKELGVELSLPDATPAGG